MGRPIAPYDRRLTIDQLSSPSRYELVDGRPVECTPAGGQHGSGNLTGGTVLMTDPAVEEAGVDVGYGLDEHNLRAPDVAVGNVPMRPGWVAGAPMLAVEYADTGTQEADLRDKIKALTARGTRWVWVVRLVGPRRVEVYEDGARTRTALPGSLLEAPGVLRNKVRVEELYDRRAALAATFRNLLQREGYESLEEVFQEGRQEGHQEGHKEGHQEGRQEGIAPLRRLFERKLGRALTGEEAAILSARLDSLGPDRLGDVALDFDGEALAIWLGDPNAT
jgi:Uma2 family endonuclease